MNQSQENSFVRDAVETSVTELFDSYGVSCDLSPSDVDVADEVIELGSIVGFRGKGVRGGLAFVAPIDLIEKLLPVPRDLARSDIQLRDWSAEMANQLVGRIKNKLSLVAMDFDVGAPVCFTGKSMRLVFVPDADGLSFAIAAGNTLVRIHLDCTLLSAFEASVGPPMSIVPEGEVILF